MDYDALFQRLAQEIIKTDGKLADDAEVFVERLQRQLAAEGYQLQGDAKALLTTYLDTINDSIKTAIAHAVTVVTGGEVIAGALQSKAALAAAEQAFSARWPDGLTLSRRLWRWRTETRLGVTEVLQSGIKQGKAVGSVIYDMQRSIERHSGGERFAVINAHKADWVDQLAMAGKELIRTPEAKQHWQKVVADTEAYIDSLAVSGTRRDAERLLTQIKAATRKGREGLIDRAVAWKVYDKQLYNLKRIARTEMATAGHQGIIAKTEHDDNIIGYQWRLSASHKVADICDYYANIDMGLGKGVWTKDTVPHEKAHPHCMCLLIPRVTPINAKGSENYADFVQNTTPERREQMLPKWAKEAVANGAPLAKLIKNDNRGLLSKREAQPIVNNATVEKIVAKLAGKAKNATSLADLWANPPSYKNHIDKRVERRHIKDEADYFDKVKAALNAADRFNLAPGKFPSVELVAGDWSVILNHNGSIKTAYPYEANMETFARQQIRLGHKLYEQKLDDGSKGQLGKLFDLR